MNFSQVISVKDQINVKHLTGLLIPMLVLLIILMMIVPLPAFLLDLFFTLNIALALIIVMISINTMRPLDFSSFPSVLLFATLLRLALNVASTRIVLVEGHTGTDAAGQVIQSFGDFVIGGDYVVGIIVFSILMIINFLVVTKGAGRVSEVSARFTLDAMPGKQMAIDADLNAGILTSEEAKETKITPSKTPNKAPAAIVITLGATGTDKPAKAIYKIKNKHLENIVFSFTQSFINI